jgi:8-oxo-dGTP pyrophosphatase MutT (NUDIX family)
MIDTMKNRQVHITTVDGKRRFACSPVAVLAIIINKREETLLLAHPEQDGGWQVVNGAMEAGETALEAALRETYEEAGSDIRVRPLGTVHVSSFHYDERVRYMLSIAYLLAYEGGKIQPGDDMKGSEYRWWNLDEMASEEVELIIPPGEKWLIARAVDLYRLWRQDDGANYPGFDLTVRGKTKA